MENDGMNLCRGPVRMPKVVYLEQHNKAISYEHASKSLVSGMCS
jgi:hypothetical protein